jgi:hypothetical protein
MRKYVLLCLSLLLVFASCSAKQASDHPSRVLFVGNSLTYVGNLPAVFSALARTNGHTVHSYMVVSPGGTLTERVADGSAAHALQQCRCTALVLQERGGDLFGDFGDDAMVQSKQAIATLTKAGHANGASVVLLGTYNAPSVSHHLVAMEGAAAQAAGIPYIAVSERLWRLHKAYPSPEWLRKAGAHPGKALTLLDAILLYKQIYGAWPAAKAFVVHAPIYGVHTGLKPKLRRANAPPPNAGAPQAVAYSASMVEGILAALEMPSS